MSKRILVAIDGSECAQKALEQAIQIASAQGARLCIANAVDEGPLAQHGMGLGTYMDIDKIKQEMRDASNALLDHALAQARAAGCQAERLLLESTARRVAEMIAEAAKQWDADLVVVGTHGRRGIERLLVGSVAENLLRLASSSLLLVR